MRAVVDEFERGVAAREHVDDDRRLAEFVVRRSVVHVEPSSQEQVGCQHPNPIIQVGFEYRLDTVGGDPRVDFEGQNGIGMLQSNRVSERRCCRSSCAFIPTIVWETPQGFQGNPRLQSKSLAVCVCEPEPFFVEAADHVDPPSSSCRDVQVWAEKRCDDTQKPEGYK